MLSAFVARAVLVAAACSILGACAAAPPEPEAAGHPYCSGREHEAAVCEQLRRAVLIEPDGTRVPLRVSGCSGEAPIVHVTLERRDTGAFLYRGGDGISTLVHARRSGAWKSIVFSGCSGVPGFGRVWLP